MIDGETRRGSGRGEGADFLLISMLTLSFTHRHFCRRVDARLYCLQPDFSGKLGRFIDFREFLLITIKLQDIRFLIVETVQNYRWCF